MQKFVLSLIATVCAGSVLAAEPAKHGCTKPEYPGKLASPTQTSRFNKNWKEYSDCINKFISEQNAAIKVAQDAAQAAIDEYNAVAAQLKADQGQ
ncbi:hypothetical protein [Parachitinimonas caeni]|uniref:Uncharacterized protein n=1 Tax=Parachitinimonas caeni TaxID=3031301 RepID=A0ABT7DRP7_9NEIS|nr:hypothetical protein [Parachitinimonas caeni]MDK2122726.1 hypothetical protein [Parachitinimonas caeni]